MAGGFGLSRALTTSLAARQESPAPYREAARAWALRSVEVAEHPELAADDLLLDPTTQALAEDPALARVRQLGRSLDPLQSAP